MNVGKAVERVVFKLKKQFVTPRRIAELRKQRSPLLRGFGDALDAHRTDALTDDERRWIELIEERRAQLNASAETVSMPDYGAGSPGDTLSGVVANKGEMITQVVGEACRNYSKPRVWAMLLFHLIRKIQPSSCIELGTCLGISAAYQASALQLNGKGRLITLEGSPAFAGIARRNLESLRLSDRAEVVAGRFQDTLPGVLDRCGKVDYAFVDGHHDEQATVRYFEQLLPRVSPQAILIFDDIAWSPGMQRAWRRISADGRVDAAFDFFNIGVCLLGAGTTVRNELALA